MSEDFIRIMHALFLPGAESMSRFARGVPPPTSIADATVGSSSSNWLAFAPKTWS